MRFEKYINFKNRRSTMQYRPRTFATITAIVAAFSMVVFLYTPVVAAVTYDPACEFQIDCDSDGVYAEDNCPEMSNPGQQDADNDGTGDACDEDTLYGYISGEFKEGIDVNIYTASCSMPTIIATLITDEDGYYSIGDLEDNWYQVSPEDYDYIFLPNSASVQISTGL